MTRVQKEGSIYARAGILDYWIVNRPDRSLEVYREPTAIDGTGDDRLVRHYWAGEVVFLQSKPRVHIPARKLDAVRVSLTGRIVYGN